jgi:NADPH-dependent ferric siderophore reductase
LTTNTLAKQKIQHPLKLRLLEVKRIVDLSASLRRITLSGEELAGFHTVAFDDHVKLLVSEKLDVPLSMPSLEGGGLVYVEGEARPVMRAYTPRRYDAVSNELDIDFVLNHGGPVTEWATQAQPGQKIGVAGPRGSIIVPTDFNWHLLIGDETALPALSRRLEELPAETHAIVVVKISTEQSRISLSSACTREERWLSATDAAKTLESVVRGLTLPAGEGFVWAGGEYHDIKAVRQYVLDELGISKQRLSAMAYWRKSQANAHDHFDED